MRYIVKDKNQLFRKLIWSHSEPEVIYFSRTTRKPTSAYLTDALRVSSFCSVLQLVLGDFHEPPLIALVLFCLFVAVHSQTLPHMSIAPQAESVFEYALTGVVPSFSPQLKSASLGMCPAASSHSISVGRRVSGVFVIF